MKKAFYVAGILLVAFMIQLNFSIPSVNAETDVDLDQSYVDGLQGNSFEDVKAELGEPDYEDDIEGIKSASWTDANYNSLTVTTGVDGEIVENTVFGEAGDEDFETVEADLNSAYNNLEYGTSYESAVEVIGVEGSKGGSGQADFGELSSTSSIYTWTTEDFTTISLAFADGSLVAKTLITADGDVEYDYDDSVAEEIEANGSENEPQADEEENNNNDENQQAEESTENDAADNNNDEEDEAAAVESDDGSDNEEGGRLPDTATSTFNWMLVGGASLAAGGLGVFLTRKKKAAAQK